jgi:hypothetical protein
MDHPSEQVDRERLVDMAQEIIAQWVETAYRTTLCGEPELHPGARRMRHLHLAEPWLPACKIADAVYAALDAATPSLAALIDKYDEYARSGDEYAREVVEDLRAAGSVGEDNQPPNGVSDYPPDNGALQ